MCPLPLQAREDALAKREEALGKREEALKAAEAALAEREKSSKEATTTSGKVWTWTLWRTVLHLGSVVNTYRIWVLMGLPIAHVFYCLLRVGYKQEGQ